MSIASAFRYLFGKKIAVLCLHKGTVENQHTSIKNQFSVKPIQRNDGNNCTWPAPANGICLMEKDQKKQVVLKELHKIF